MAHFGPLGLDSEPNHGGFSLRVSFLLAKPPYSSAPAIPVIGFIATISFTILFLFALTSLSLAFTLLPYHARISTQTSSTMIHLSRRWLRQLTNVAVILVFASGLLLLANKNRLIVLEKYIGADLMPQYFQPPSDAYVIDLAVQQCLLMNKNSPTCGQPNSDSGKYGELNTAGNWTRVDKDLLLSLSWVWKTYLLAKKIEPEFQEVAGHDVVVDVWVGIPSMDCAISKNTHCIPKKVLEDIHKMRVFGDEEYAQLQEDSKDIVGQVEGDKDKSALAYYEKYHKEKEKTEKEKTEKEKAEKEAHKVVEESEETKEGKQSESTNPKEVEGEKDTPTNEESEDTNSESKDTNSESNDTKDESNDAKDESNDAKDESNDPKEESNNPKEESKESTDTQNGIKNPEAESQAEQAEAELKEPLIKRGKETSRHKLQGYLLIPTPEQLHASGWKKVTNGIWVKYGPASPTAVTGVDVLFGPDAVDPRPGWTLLPHPLQVRGAQTGLEPRLTIRRGRKLDYTSKQMRPALKFGSDGKFKVLQVADLHFSTGVGRCRDPVPAETAEGCEADPRTLRFLEKVLALEKPDFVVMTGDQVFGQAAPDPETALFKAVQPFVQRKIPYAITLGNHDDESGVMLREQMMQLAASLPYSLLAVGLAEVDGYGNYALTVEGGWTGSTEAALYFMDSHSYSKKPKTNPGYDWFKESQLTWLELEAASVMDEAGKKATDLVSMAFFHIPIPEFRETANKPIVGQMREGVASTRYATDIRAALGAAGVQVVAVGHDHANDYCLLDTQNKETDEEHRLWLCYGGGVGEGGYGGYGGYIRRMRVYEVDSQAKAVRTWKRAENDPNTVFDVQQVVAEGAAVGHV